MSVTVSRKRAFLAEADDNVAVAMFALNAGERVGIVRDFEATEGPRVRLVEAIPFGHKLAVRAIAAGTPVQKFGHQIGVATQDIPAGGHVHVQNLRGLRG